ncbi:hypothetical protein KCP75_23375 [Salmonella enterica subsp. enterica]|nr:hypothetical protein KCP75_23375 [Salmonella enterica subsp. enterica]
MIKSPRWRTDKELPAAGHAQSGTVYQMAVKRLIRPDWQAEYKRSAIRDNNVTA